jgi:hypothetical protein
MSLHQSFRAVPAVRARFFSRQQLGAPNPLPHTSAPRMAGTPPHWCIHCGARSLSLHQQQQQHLPNRWLCSELH